MGRANFQAASDHALARRYDLSAVYSSLAENFQTTRTTLPDMQARIFSLDAGDHSLPYLLAAN